MVIETLRMDLLAFHTATKPPNRLEARMVEFLEGESTTEALDGAAFDHVNGAQTKADYFLGSRGIVAELKTINADPHDPIEQRLKERLARPDAPIVFGSVGVSKVLDGLIDGDSISKMMVDLSGRAVRRHLRKANEQIAAVKQRFELPHAAGLVILMNDSQPMIDASAIGYAIKSAFETVEGGYPHITNVWASIESHKIMMPGERAGYPQLHVFKSLERRRELEFIGRMLAAWGHRHGGRMERLQHRGDWDVMRPIYEGHPPALSPFA